MNTICDIKRNFVLNCIYICALLSIYLIPLPLHQHKKNGIEGFKKKIGNKRESTIHVSCLNHLFTFTYIASYKSNTFAVWTLCVFIYPFQKLSDIINSRLVFLIQVLKINWHKMMNIDLYLWFNIWLTTSVTFCKRRICFYTH